MSKVLITSGCSFSECIHYTNPAFRKNWPIHLAEILKLEGYDSHISTAMPSQGNGLISRSTLYAVIEALKTYKAEDILVGVMWSGASRHDYRCTNPKLLNFVKKDLHNNTVENPTGFVKDTAKNWVILNVNWASDEQHSEAYNYYKFFYDDLGAGINSLEQILLLQYFLQKNKVPYFFTNYSDNNIVLPKLKNHREIKYLFEQLDIDKYLPVTSEFQWLVDNNILTHEWTNDIWKNVMIDGSHKWNQWIHPTANQHKEFCDKIIVKFLKEKYAGIVFNG